jgi:hypothetical protein
MKKTSLLLACLLAIVLMAGSCTTMKKDCQGNRHTKLKNGIYL